MTAVIHIKKRTTQGKMETKALLAQDVVPGVMYGEALETRMISVERNTLHKAMHQKTGSGLLDIQVEGDSEPVKAIVHDWQTNPVSGAITHVDLYQVRMDKILHTEIPLNFTGVSLAVKNLGGTLVKQMSEIEVACLPGDLVNHIDVLLEQLATFDDAIHIKDLVMPQGIAASADADDIVVNVAPPRSEEEIASLNKEVDADVSKIEVTAEKKEEAGAEAGDAVKDKDKVKESK